MADNAGTYVALSVAAAVIVLLLTTLVFGVEDPWWWIAPLAALALGLALAMRSYSKE